MKVYAIRHAIRQQPEEFAEAEEGDPEAELTPEGEEIATSLGEWMANKNEIPSVIYASPTVRAQQTAEHIADAIKAAGFAPPDVKTDVGVGPFKSIRALVQKAAADGAKRVAIVSHRGTIVNGLKALAVDNGDDPKVDPIAMGEMRALDVKRKSGKWSERYRVRPSDLGHDDQYG